MKIAYDWEFLERGPDVPIVPISLGMVREDGERLYLINGEMPLSTLVRAPWLQLNVLPYLPLTITSDHTANYTGSIIEWDAEHHDYPYRVGLDEMRHRVREFTDVDKPELWTYYGAYDHVLLAQLFGTMTDWPQHLPMYSNDVMQDWNRLGRPQLPATEAMHHALHDAQWTLDCVRALALFELAADAHDEEAAELLRDPGFRESVIQYQNGQGRAIDLGYLSLPAEVQDEIEAHVGGRHHEQDGQDDPMEGGRA